jgi:hypothetical protein
MSGFFESLAARARGEAPAVRPRLPGIFESSAAEGFEQTEVFVEAARPDAAAPVQAAPPAVAEVRHYWEPPERPSAAPVPGQAAEPAQPAAPPPRGVAPEDAAEPSRPVPTALPPQPAPARDATPPPAPATVQATQDRGRHDDTPPAPVRPASVQRPRDDLTVRTVPVTARAASMPPNLAPPPADLPPPGLTSPPARSGAREIVPQVARARPAPPQPVAAPRQEETTVHVSIGRIEVRAVQPPPEARPREPAKSAVMSLDEYLRSRRERR